MSRDDSHEVTTAASPAATAAPAAAVGTAGAAPRRKPRVSFLGGTTHSRTTVGLHGVDREVVDRESADGEPPPPAGCPCSSGF